MKAFSMIFFDLDGTLLLKDHKTVSERTKAMLLNIHEQGTKLAISTGRVHCILPPDLTKEIPFDYVITSNGADVMSLADGSHPITHYIKEADARAAYDVLKNYDIAIEWYQGNEIMLLANDAEHILDVPKAPWHDDYFRLGKFPVYQDAEAFFAAGTPKLEKINPLMRAHKEEYADVYRQIADCGLFSLSNSLGHNLEINALGCTKGVAILELCALLRIDPKTTLAFGDGNNDLEMLSICGTGVAMGNAMDALKEAADFVTDDCEHDGIAAFIEQC